MQQHDSAGDQLREKRATEVHEPLSAGRKPALGGCRSNRGKSKSLSKNEIAGVMRFCKVLYRTLATRNICIIDLDALSAAFAKHSRLLSHHHTIHPSQGNVLDPSCH
jgi:hypothetical protein